MNYTFYMQSGGTAKGTPLGEGCEGVRTHSLGTLTCSCLVGETTWLRIGERVGILQGGESR